MKNILLLVHDDDGQEARFQAALDLTRALDGHLSCLDVTVLPVMVGDYYGGGEVQAMLLADETERETKNKTALQARLEHEDVAWDWTDATGSITTAIHQAAMLADLIVLNRKLDSFANPDMGRIVSELVVQARAPIVAVPPSYKRFELGRALIAWDGEASAAATLRACVPLLRIASEVEIFTVLDNGVKTAPDEAAEYLSRHGIHANVQAVEAGTHTPDQLITDECTRWHPDYVVMGAYSHGRLRETFGGVTTRMLANATLPLVLGH